jgi:holliday junction DNA helicase RuvB
MIMSSNKEQEEQKRKKQGSKVHKPLPIEKEFWGEDDVNLRPEALDEYIGQGHMIKQLRLILDSAKIRKTLPEHLLFYGQPGLGKTTIASLISAEMQAHFKIIAAPGLQKIGDLVSILVSLEPKTILFIDEIHRLKAPLEETLYSAMEDRKVDLVTGKGAGGTVARLDIEAFTLVGATTQLGKLSKPLKDRFPSIFHLEPYKDEDMLKLIERNCKLLNITMSQGAKMLICKRSRGTPRIANNIMKRLLDYSIVHGAVSMDEVTVTTFLHEIGILDRGLTKTDIRYLKSLTDGSIGLKTLSGMLLEEADTIEMVVEPYLIYLGFVDKSSEGRRLTPKGQDFLKTYRGN